ncbi:MAG: synthase chain [Candidatus Brocadiaceae bacterium]|nr:synthase chain [Candidatus Brocadiaceae bacterium]
MEDEKDAFELFDEGFPDRALKTSFYLSLVLIACSLSYMSVMLTVSLALGCFISLTLCSVLWRTIRRSLKRDKSEIKSIFLRDSIVKYVFVGVLLLMSCLFLDVNVAAMAIGLGIVVAVIMMKAGSRLLVSYVNRAVKSSGVRPSNDG